MRHRISKDLYAYWRDIRGARAAPDRAEIDPAAIRGLLADTFILEVKPGRVYPLRMAGTRVDALWGRDRKGNCFTEFWRPADRFSVADALLTVTEAVSPVVSGARLRSAGDAALEMELLLLPLRLFGCAPARILGALSPLHPGEWPGRPPRGPLEMVSTRVIGEAGGSLPPPRRQTPKFVVYTADIQQVSGVVGGSGKQSLKS